MPDVAHHTHHAHGIGAPQPGRAGHGRDPEALPYRLLSAESVMCENVINHNDRLTSPAIMIIVIIVSIAVIPWGGVKET